MNEYLNVEIIEEYILNNGLTKRSFCEQCKISISTLYRILRKKQCYLISLFKIARTMQIEIYCLFK